jgi:hypothetical protein
MLLVFVTFTVVGADDWPTVTFPKDMLGGEIVAPLCVPKPFKVTTSGLDAALDAIEKLPVKGPADRGANLP